MREDVADCGSRSRSHHQDMIPEVPGELARNLFCSQSLTSNTRSDAGMQKYLTLVVCVPEDLKRAEFVDNVSGPLIESRY